MTSRTVAPYGSWRSPLTAANVASGGVQIAALSPHGGGLLWTEMRPAEGGRTVVVRHSPDGRTEDATPAGFNVRTRVHEYGGGAFTAHDGTIFFSNFADQRVYRQRAGEAPQPLTAEPAVNAGERYADYCLTPDGRTLLCVRESHRPGAEATNELVAIPLDGEGDPRTVVSGSDFYSFPRVSPDGRRLAWTCWDHPRMPWDGTELWVADLGSDGSTTVPQLVAGGPGESIFQPQWSPQGVLHFVSDRTGWWNLYAWQDGATVPLAPAEAEFGVPQWGFGLSTYAFLADGGVVCAYRQGGRDHLGVIRPGSGAVSPLPCPFTSIESLRAEGDRVAFIGASASEPKAVVEGPASGSAWRTVRRSRAADLAAASVATPEAVAFPTDGGATAHALFYRPTSAEFEGPPGELPPLLVFSHGGPTSAASGAFNSTVQFWTSRGFAVADVDYGGSTGYGREYRQRLNGRWGVVDTADCVNAARHLVSSGQVDGAKLAIRGGSAGGYTTLCALTFYDLFHAGASYYGVADAEALAAETHKFESRYLDGLIGPYPEARDLYRERSPIHFTDRLSCPVILFHGLEDEVVPPAQAEMIAGALRRKGLPFAYLPFEGEQHGFRRSENIERALEAELYFYGRVFGFDPADAIEPVTIENL